MLSLESRIRPVYSCMSATFLFSISLARFAVEILSLALRCDPERVTPMLIF